MMKLVIIMFMNTAKFSEPKITDFFFVWDMILQGIYVVLGKIYDWSQRTKTSWQV